MKKLICIICALTMIAAVGCGSSDSSTANKGKTVGDILSSAAKDSDSSSESSSAAESSSEAASKSDSSSVKYDKIDTDLSAMSETMAYAELSNMLTEPEKYKGKIVKIKGYFAVSNDNGNTYFACMLTDATACCSQPLEFVLADSRSFPADYPEVDSLITVTGVFGTYNEGANEYCQLSNAQLV